MPNPDDNNNPEAPDAPRGASQAGEGEAPDEFPVASRVDAEASDYFEWLPPEIFFYYIYPHLSSVDVARLARMARRYRDLKVAIPEDLWERFCKDIFKQVKPKDSSLTHRQFFESRCADLRSVQQAMQQRPQPTQGFFSGLFKKRGKPLSLPDLLKLICQKGILPALEQFSCENEDYLDGLDYEKYCKLIEISVSNNHPPILGWLLDRVHEKWGELAPPVFDYVVCKRKPDCVRHLVDRYRPSFNNSMLSLLNNSDNGKFLVYEEQREIADIFIGKATPEEVTQLFDEVGQRSWLGKCLHQLIIINYDFGNLVSEGWEKRIGSVLDKLKFIVLNMRVDFDINIIYEVLKQLVGCRNNFRLFGEKGETITKVMLLAETVLGAWDFERLLNESLNHIKAICEDSGVNEEEANNNLKILFRHLSLILRTKPLAHSSKEDQVVDRICEILEAHPEVLRLTVEGKTLFDYFFNEGDKGHYFSEVPKTLLNDNYSKRNKCTRDYLRVLTCMVRLNGQSLEESAAFKYAEEFGDQKAIDVLTDPVLLGDHREEAEATPPNDQGAGSLMAHRKWMADFHGDPTASDSKDEAGTQLADMSFVGG